MDIPQVALAVISALAGPAASIKVASLQAGRAVEDLTKRLARTEERVGNLEATEPETQAKLREDVGTLEREVTALRLAVDRLTAAHEKLVADDEKRREKAAERAERREVREREQETAIATRLERVHTLLDTLRQEIHRAR